MRVAVLFGSEARGTARPGSDVDVAVDVPGVDILDLGATLAVALDREVDEVALEDATIALLERLVREGIVVHDLRAIGLLEHRSACVKSVPARISYESDALQNVRAGARNRSKS